MTPHRVTHVPGLLCYPSPRLLIICCQALQLRGYRPQEHAIVAHDREIQYSIDKLSVVGRGCAPEKRQRLIARTETPCACWCDQARSDQELQMPQIAYGVVRSLR